MGTVSSSVVYEGIKKLHHALIVVKISVYELIRKKMYWKQNAILFVVRQNSEPLS